MKPSLRPGVTRTNKIVIDRPRTIGFMGKEARTYATPAMIRDIEYTCRDLILEHADAGEDSVGMEVAVKHLAPTLMGMTVEITVHDANHKPLNGATVVGHWSQLGMNSNTCTTGDLGGNGTCTMLFPSLKRSVTFVNLTVVSVTLAGRTYDRTLNHDVDGSSNGTTVRVNRP